MKFTVPKYDEDDEEEIIGSETFTWKLDYEMTGEYITKVIIKNENNGEIE